LLAKPPCALPEADAKALDAVDEVLALMRNELEKCRKTADNPDVTVPELSQVIRTAGDIDRLAYGLKIDLMFRVG
jgi:hypothetical protein